MRIKRTVATTILMLVMGTASAQTVLDFEAPSAVGLTPMSYWEGTFVDPAARVTNQYLDLGVLISNAALVGLGYGHAASGTNGLAGIDVNGYLDYDAPVSFSFFSPNNSAATTDYFAYSADLGGWSGNTITMTAYDNDGNFVGQSSYVETGVFTTPLELKGVGQFHKVTIDQTLYNHWSGGIGIDLVQYGALTPSVVLAPVPEPETYAMMLAGLGLLGVVARRRRQKLKA